jgi:hypothetical protein
MLLKEFNPMNDSPLFFPALECAHIIGMIAIDLFGMILLLDYNAFFQTNLTLLALVGVHALIFRRGVYRSSAALDAAPRILSQAKLAASLSLLLWTGLVIAGRGIGYIEPPLDNIRARLLAAPAIASTAVPADRRL